MTEPKKVEITWENIRRHEYELRSHEIVSALTAAAAGVVPDRVTITSEFPIEPTLVQTMHSQDERVVVTSIRCEVTRYSGRRSDDDEGYVRVEMFAQATKADGTPHGGRTPSWISAPEELAGPLMVAAFTRSLIPTKG